MAKTVAVLGIGLMGAGMGRSLLRAGLDVVVWNRNATKAEPLASDGARVASGNRPVKAWGTRLTFAPHERQNFTPSIVSAHCGQYIDTSSLIELA